MTVSAKKAPVSCALALAAVVGLPGCATPETGTPNPDTCMAPETTRYFLGLAETTKTEFNQDCGAAEAARVMAKIKLIETDEPDPRAIASALTFYRLSNPRTQKLFDAMLAQEGLTVQSLERRLDDAQRCKTLSDGQKGITVVCPKPL